MDETAVKGFPIIVLRRFRRVSRYEVISFIETDIRVNPIIILLFSKPKTDYSLTCRSAIWERHANDEFVHRDIIRNVRNVPT